MSSYHEKRLTERRSIRESNQEPVEATLRTIHNEVIPVEIQDLSLGGAQVRSELVFSRPPAQLKDLTLQFANGERILAHVTPIHIQTLHEVWSAGFQFLSPSVDLLRRLCSYFLHGTSPTTAPLFGHRLFGEITRRDEIVEHLNKSAAQNESYRLFATQEQTPLGTFFLDEIQTAQGRIRGESPIPLEVGNDYLLARFTSNTVYYFQTTLLRSRNGDLVFALPQRIARGGKRNTARVDIPEQQGLTVEFIHPMVPGKALRKAIREVSIRGLSFDVDWSTDLLVPGMIISAGLLRIPNKPPIHCSFVIRNIEPRSYGVYRCGVELLEFFGTHRQHWLESALSFLAPAVREAHPWELDIVWDIYQRSGYLGLRDEDILAQQKERFESQWGRLGRTNNNAKLFLFEDQNQPIGTIAITRIYSQAWLIHQLAALLDEYRNPQEKLEVLYNLIPQSTLHWTMGLEKPASIIGTFDATSRLNKWMWLRFKERYTDDKLSEVQQGWKYYHYELDSLDATLPTTRLGWGEPNELERSILSQDLYHRDGSLAHKMFDYEQEKLELSFWKQEREDNIFQHQRRLFVARDGQRMVGYAILESSQPGINIFSLYNTFRIILLEPNTPTGKEVYDFLFAHVVRHYLEQNVETIIQTVGPYDASIAPEKYSVKHDALRLLVSPQHMPLLVSYLADTWHRQG
ncbi:MAG: PilZ domain-containing protein [Deltaproteobacteria bacterium]|nr:MAG: PilZ domain-containing protein [Deltaproteobacteria bacterium]